MPQAEVKSNTSVEVVETIIPSHQGGSTADSTVAADPLNAFAEGRRYRQALRALDVGDLETARAAQAELEKSVEFSVLAKAIEALLLIKDNKPEQAISLAEDISVVPAMQAESYVIAGEAFQKKNQLAEAISAFESAVALNPANERAHRWLGAVYYDTGAMRYATNHLRKAADLVPNEINSLLLSAKIFQDYEQYDEAIQDYEALFGRNPKPEIRTLGKIKQAECYVAVRKLEQAKAALVSCPESPASITVRAAIAESEGQLDEAAGLAEKVLRDMPKQRLAILILARVLTSQKRWDEALNIVEPLAAQSPYDHEVRMLYGRALIGAGEKARGQEEVKQASKIKDTFLMFADLHQTAISSPNDAKIRVQLGELAENLGKKQLALVWYQAAIGLDSNNSQAKSAIERLSK